MKLIKACIFVLLLTVSSFASQEEKININFKDLEIMDLVKVTSKIIDKNILMTQDIKGKVDFISNKPVNKDELIKILIYVLEEKGFTLVTNDNILRIVKLNESVKSNVPVITPKNKNSYNQIVTEIFRVESTNVDFIASKIRHLISRDAKLVANKEANTIVLTDFMDNINTVKKIVNIMTIGSKKTMEVVELKNIQAPDAQKSLDAISKAVFNQTVEIEKVDVISNKESNSLVIIGKKKNVNYLKNYIIKMDSKESLIKRVVEVYPLKNVEAANVNKIIEGIIGKKKYIDPNDKPLSSVDEETNAIVLMGPSDEVDYIKELIRELDKDKPQVFVKAKIIEVSENKTRNIGVEYGLSGGISGSDGLFSFASNMTGNVLALDEAIQNVITMPKDLTKGLALGATLNLLKENQAIDVISEPSILCINNKESSIYVGETRSFEQGSTTNESGTTSSYTREDIGLTLKVKPRISNENKVTLELETILEDAKEIRAGQTNPDTTKKEVKTSAIVTNGEAVIIGGLIKNKADITNVGIPFISDIPLLGELFKNKKTVNDKVNLVVIVTPYIIPKSKDLTYIRNQLSKLTELEAKFTQKLKDELEKRKKEKENKEKVDEESEEHQKNTPSSDVNTHQEFMKQYLGN